MMAPITVVHAITSSRSQLEPKVILANSLAALNQETIGITAVRDSVGLFEVAKSWA